MTTNAIPPRMDRTKAEETCRRYPETVACRVAQEQAADWERFLAELRAENDRIRDDRLSRLEAEREQQKEDARQQAESELVEHLRQQFLSSSRAATEDDFQRLLPTLRDQFLLRESIEAFDREKRAALARIPPELRM